MSVKIISLLISGYIRKNKYEATLGINIPSDIHILIGRFYPSCIDFEGSRLALSLEEKDTITEYLTKTLICNEERSYILSSTLLYNGECDGFGSKEWHRKCDHNINTITIIQTTFNHIFGCFATVAFDGTLKSRKDDKKSFLCLIRSQFENAECPKLCPYTVGWGDYGPFNHVDYGPCFGHSFDVGIFAKSYAQGSESTYENYVNHSEYTNYPGAIGNELCGGTEYDATNVGKTVPDRAYLAIHFEIKCIETHRIDVKENYTYGHVRKISKV
eukprot:480252_1